MRKLCNLGNSRKPKKLGNWEVKDIENVEGAREVEEIGEVKNIGNVEETGGNEEVEKFDK